MECCGPPAKHGRLVRHPVRRGCGDGGGVGHDWLVSGFVVLWKPFAVREVSGRMERGESALQVNIGWLYHLTRGFYVLLSCLPGHNIKI